MQKFIEFLPGISVHTEIFFFKAGLFCHVLLAKIVNQPLKLFNGVQNE